MKDEITLVYPDIKGNSGTKSYVQNTFNGLKSIGVEFSTISIKKREISIGGKPYFGILFQYFSSLFKEGRTKVVHALSPDVVIRGTNIVTIHDIIPFTNPEIYIKSTYDRAAYKLSFTRALEVQLLLVSTEVGKNSMMDRVNISPERIRVVNHSIDHTRFFPESENPYPEDGKINILMVSDFNPRKRIDLVVDAIGGDREINFYHIGPSQGWSERYHEILKKAENYKNIKFLGPLDIKKLRQYMTFADVFVFLSDNEGFGLTPLEAMACGTNVIVNDLPVFQEVLGNMAYFVKLSSFNRDNIMEAIKHKKPGYELIEFSKNYSMEKHALKLKEVYGSVLHKDKDDLTK